MAGGTGGNNTLDLSRLTMSATVTITCSDGGQADYNGHSVPFAQIQSVTAGSGNDTICLDANAAELTGSIDTGTGTDTIAYWNCSADRTVYVDFANGGRLSRAAGTTPFTGVENITTNSGSDRAVFAPGASLAGTINLGVGADTFDYTAWNATQPISVNLQTGQASGTGG